MSDNFVVKKNKISLKKKNLKNRNSLILKKNIIKLLIDKKILKYTRLKRNNNIAKFLKAVVLQISLSKKRKIIYKFFKNKYLKNSVKKTLLKHLKTKQKIATVVTLIKKKLKKKTVKLLNNSLVLKKKKINLEYILNTILPVKLELRLNNFLNSKNTPSVFKKKYKKLYSIYKHKRLNFYNKQFKEVFSSLAISLLLCKSSMLMLIISRTLGNGRFRYFKRNLYYIFTNLFLLQRRICPFNAIKVNISGKFKGKAKRTNLHYRLSPGLFDIRGYTLSKINFYVGYVATQTGIFGIKVWMS